MLKLTDESLIDRVKTEVREWLGGREKLGVKVLSCETVTEPSPQLHIYILDPMIPVKYTGYIAIDLVRERVDLEHSVNCTSMFSGPREDHALINWGASEVWRSVEKRLPRFAGNLAFHIDLFVLLRIRSAYETLLANRQRAIEDMYGHSRRFESIIACIGPQLDEKTRALFKTAMDHLWKQVIYMNRSPNFHEASELLSTCHVTETLFNYSFHPSDSHPDDPGPHVQENVWTNADGDQVAAASVFLDFEDHVTVVVQMRILLAFFDGKEAELLLKRFREKTVIDQRTEQPAEK